MSNLKVSIYNIALWVINFKHLYLVNWLITLEIFLGIISKPFLKLSQFKIDHSLACMGKLNKETGKKNPKQKA